MGARAANSLLLLLLLAHVLLAATGWVLLDRHLWPEPLFAILLALAASQISLWAIWAGMSRLPGPLRLATLLTCCGYYGVYFGGALREEALMFLVQSLLIAAPLARFRRLQGLDLQRPPETSHASPPAASHGPPQSSPIGPTQAQFSLAEMVLWTTIAALICGVPHYLELSGRELLIPLVASGCFAMIGLAGVWIALRHGPPGRRLAVASMLCWMVAMALASLVPGIGEATFTFALLCELKLLLVAGSLMVLRVCGYRLVREPWRHLHSPIDMAAE
ncbi:MAG: hypothetical protein WD403_05275 [Pirellulales bacterium]